MDEHGFDSSALLDLRFPPSDWRCLREGAWVSAHALVQDWVTLSAGVVIYPFAFVGHLASRSPALARPGLPQRQLTIGTRTEIGPHSVIYGGAEIGADCLIGDGVSIREDVKIGKRCVIGRHVTINCDVEIGDEVRIMDGSHITDGMRIGSGSFFGVGVVTSSDRRREVVDYVFQGSNAPMVGMRCLIGSGANLLPGVKIGDGAVVGAGAVVVKDLEGGAVILARRAIAPDVPDLWPSPFEMRRSGDVL